MTSFVTPRELVALIHGRSGKGCVVVTGAGVSALNHLFSQPGASRTMLDAQVPYSSRALTEYVGKLSEQNVSAVEAQLMSSSAFKRAQHLTNKEENTEILFGVGCTAALATDRARRGEDRAHISWTNGVSSGESYIWFDKSNRTRPDEEELVSAMVLNAVASAIGIEERIKIEELDTEQFNESN